MQIRIHLIIIILASWITSCNLEKDSSEPLIVVAIRTEPDNLHPTNWNSAATTFFFGYLHKTLLERNPKQPNELTTTLLSKFPEPVDSNGLQYRFTLKKIYWPNGEILKTSDVEFSILAVLHPFCNNANHKATYSPHIKDFKTINDSVFDLYYSNPYPGNLQLLTDIFLLQKSRFKDVNVLSLSFVSFDTSKSATQFFETFNDLNPYNYADGINGLGDYRLTKWEKGKYISLQNKKNAQKINFRIIPDEQVLKRALLNHEIDMALDVSPDIFVNLDSLTFQKHLIALPGYTFIAFNLKPTNGKKLFDFPEIKQAITLCCPIDFIIKNLLHNTVQKQHNYLPHNHPMNSKHNVCFNPDSAVVLLQQNGWTHNKQGIFQKTNNQTTVTAQFELSFVQIPLFENVVACLSHELKQIGIDCVPKGLSPQAWQNAAFEQNFEAWLGSWSGVNGYTDPKPLFHTSEWLNKNMNFTGFGTKTTDSIIEAMNQSTETSTLSQLSTQLQAEIMKEQPYLFLHGISKKIVVNRKFKQYRIVEESPWILFE